MAKYLLMLRDHGTYEGLSAEEMQKILEGLGYTNGATVETLAALRTPFAEDGVVTAIARQQGARVREVGECRATVVGTETSFQAAATGEPSEPGSMPSTIIWPYSTGVGGRDRPRSRAGWDVPDSQRRAHDDHDRHHDRGDGRGPPRRSPQGGDGVDVGLRTRMPKTFLDDSDAQSLDAAFERLRVARDLGCHLPRIKAVRTGELDEQLNQSSKLGASRKVA